MAIFEGKRTPLCETGTGLVRDGYEPRTRLGLPPRRRSSSSYDRRGGVLPKGYSTESS